MELTDEQRLVLIRLRNVLAEADNTINDDGTSLLDILEDFTGSSGTVNDFCDAVDDIYDTFSNKG